MTKQTQDYISLKPISDRFREVAVTISNHDIEFIIKDEIREQVRKQIDFSELGEVISEWVDTWLEDYDNCEFVLRCIKESIERKFK